MDGSCCRRWKTSSVGLAVSLLLCLLFLEADVVSSDSSSMDETTANGPYEWEGLDFYQILGFEDDSSASSQQIKKAYRKQAQQWHPDKQIGKANSTVSVEESNARFARISEAYQVLSDDDKRREYDRFLDQQMRLKQQQESRRQYQRQQQEEERASAPSSSSTWSWSNFGSGDFSFQDARSLFEDFFFKEDEAEEDDFLRDFSQQFDGSGGGYGSSFFQDHHPDQRGGYYQQQQQYEPVSVHEEEQIWIDPMTGQEILRILQTEEYLVDNNRRYVRVLGQDFIEKWDRYQRMWVYVPLQLEPVIVEEGYREAPSASNRRQQQHGSFRNQQQRQQHAHHESVSAREVFGDQDRSVLFIGEALTSEHRLVNDRFYAGISRSAASFCELVIVDALWDNAVVWTSGTASSQWYYHGDSCQLELRGPYLMLSSGYPQYELLWHSDAHDDHDTSKVSEDDPSYVARLDSDGSLAVYHVESVPTGQRREWSRILLTVLHRIGLVDDVMLAVPPVNLVCISATGSLVGCNRLLRPVVRFLRDAFFLVKKVFTAIDRFIEDTVPL